MLVLSATADCSTTRSQQIQSLYAIQNAVCGFNVLCVRYGIHHVADADSGPGHVAHGLVKVDEHALALAIGRMLDEETGVGVQVAVYVPVRREKLNVRCPQWSAEILCGRMEAVRTLHYVPPQTGEFLTGITGRTLGEPSGLHLAEAARESRGCWGWCDRLRGREVWLLS